MPKATSIEDALLALSEGLTHAARNPNIKHYVPHAKQEIFHKSTKKKKLYIGGNRSGKTTGGVCEDIWRATCTHPYRADLNSIGPNRGRLVTVDFTNGVEKIIFPQFKQWLYPSAMRGGAWETAYDKTLRTLHFENGSFIEFMSYDQDLDKFAGTSRHWIHFDEEPPKPIYGECMARLIDTNGDFYLTMTPVEGMTWVYDDLYEANVEKDNGDVEVIEISMRENPYLKKEAIDNFIGGYDEEERQIREEGKFVQVGGLIYKNFDPRTGGTHVLSDFIDSPKQRFKDWMWIMALDHGLNNPTAVLWLAVSQRGEIVVFHEHYQKEWTVDQHATEIHRINKLLGRRPDLLVADPSIKNRNAITNTSVHEEYARLGLAFTPGNNDVKSGIIRVKRYLNPRSEPDNEHPRGSNPLLTIDPRCVKLIWELKKYRWKKYVNKKLAYENNPYDEPQKKDDHACDALRYALMTQPDLHAETESNTAQRIREAIDGFSFVHAGPDNIADPNDLRENPNWTTDNSIPAAHSDGAWDYDEHMGGVF